MYIFNCFNFQEQFAFRGSQQAYFIFLPAKGVQRYTLFWSYPNYTVENRLSFLYWLYSASLLQLKTKNLAAGKLQGLFRKEAKNWNPFESQLLIQLRRSGVKVLNSPVRINIVCNELTLTLTCVRLSHKWDSRYSSQLKYIHISHICNTCGISVAFFLHLFWNLLSFVIPSIASLNGNLCAIVLSFT